MEKTIIYSKKNFTQLFQHWKFVPKIKNPKNQEEALENFVFKTNVAYVRISKSANDLRYVGFGIQAIWDLSICFPFGWIHKTLKRDDDEDLTKVQAYINKKLKKYKYNVIDLDKDSEKDNIGDIYVRNIEKERENG